MAPENRLYGATLNFHVPPAPASLYGTAAVPRWQNGAIFGLIYFTPPQPLFIAWVFVRLCAKAALNLHLTLVCFFAGHNTICFGFRADLRVFGSSGSSNIEEVLRNVAIKHFNMPTGKTSDKSLMTRHDYITGLLMRVEIRQKYLNLYCCVFSITCKCITISATHWIIWKPYFMKTLLLFFSQNLWDIMICRYQESYHTAILIFSRK